MEEKNGKLYFDDIERKYAPSLPADLAEHEAGIALDAITDVLIKLKEDFYGAAGEFSNASRGAYIILKNELNHLTVTQEQLRNVVNREKIAAEFIKLLSKKSD